LALLLTLALTGCGQSTSLLLEVTSPMSSPGQIDGLQISVRGDTAGNTIDQRYELSTDWPHTVSIRPGTMETGPVTITVTADLDGTFVARRVVRSAFITGSEVRVLVDIPSECAGVMCGPDRDCVAGRCDSVDPMDGGTRDAGVPSDGGGDCTLATDCNDDVNCTVDTCADGVCSHVPDDGLCVEGSTCDVMTGCPPRVCATDGDCSDGLVCNGAELCGDMSCTPGTPIDCDDADACTADSCDEPSRGDCMHTTRDMDGDGFGDSACAETGGVAATDCADGNPMVNPDGVEVCNGIDDNCSGTCDDGFACCRGTSTDCMTACGTTGRRVCNAACTLELCAAPAETCNAVDDDCNGAADDIFACVRDASEPCTTACGSASIRTCLADCTWGSCGTPTEVCNGIDDDCDGTPDNGFSCVSGTSTPCATSCDPAGTMTGAVTCDATTCEPGACTPPAEGCTGRDDDCDGLIDESAECMAGTVQACTTACGSTGTQTCSASCIFDACVPPAEVCNGVDDNCDGRIDETFTCVPSATRDCTTGCSTMGTQTCQSDCSWGTCAPPAEACNGTDDDCDMMCDETFTCCAGESGSCMTSCGTTGSRTCSGACGWNVCSPPAEVCNGVDDDCNTACDDGPGMACCAGSTGSCTTSCGSTGTRECAADCSWGACTVPDEICNGVDDNCDTVIDEGFACSPDAVTSCTTSCGSTGTSTCGSDCTVGACVPPTELCNGVDDNCDSVVDEGCGSCASCGGATSVSAPGGRFMVPLVANAETGSCGGGGSEGYLTFTLTTAADVFITTHHSAVDTVLYVRECSCDGAERACNDDADGLVSSALQLTSLAAGTYNVFVDTETTMSGPIAVDIYISVPGTESDRCGNPSFISAGTTSITGNTCSFGADYEPAASTGCPFVGSGGANERVYYAYLPTARAVTFNGCVAGSSYDQTIFLRDVCSDGALANQQECNDDGCSGPPQCDRARRSSMSATIGPGLYYFFADGYLGGTCDCGDFAYATSGL